MWVIFLLVGVFLFILVPLFSVLPRFKRDTSPFDRTIYAHRGLHDHEKGIPENSLAAFAAAVKAGYGVELDVQFTADKQLVVFHDNDLKRMCGIDKRVDELAYADLRELHLLDSDQHIPLLSDVLDVLDGATLLCEFKTMRSFTDAALCAAALPMLDAYKGSVCIESFNPIMVRWFRKHAPQYIRGILSQKFKGGEVPRAMRFPLASLFTNCLCRPDFIAYRHTDYKQPFFWLCRLFRPMTIAWTVQSENEAQLAKRHFDTIIFEGYLPEKK